MFFIEWNVTKYVINTLASGRKRGFSNRNTATHVTLRRNYSAPLRVTDLVEASKDAASLPECNRKKFLVGRCGFFVSDVISGRLLGPLGPLYLALGANRQIRGNEPICYRGPLCQLPLSNRAAQPFSHTMKLVSSRLLVSPEWESSILLVLPECFAGPMRPASLMFVTPALHGSISLKFLLETKLHSESFDTLDDLLGF